MPRSRSRRRCWAPGAGRRRCASTCRWWRRRSPAARCWPPIDSLALFGPQAIIGTPAQIVFLPTRIYATIGSYPPRWGEASALSLVLVRAHGARACPAARLSGAALLHHRRRARRAHQAASSLGAWRWPLLAFCSTVVFFSAVAPIGVLALTAFSKSWIEPLVARQLHAGALRRGPVPRPGRRCAASSTASGSPPPPRLLAVLDRRCRRLSRPAHDGARAPAARLPGDPAAGAAGNGDGGRHPAGVHPPAGRHLRHDLDPARAYVARFIPLATRSANATFRQIDPSLEEAGRITGASLVARHPAHPVPAVAPRPAGRVPAGLHPGLQRAQRHHPALHRRHRDHRHRHLSPQRSGPARGRLGAGRVHHRRGPDAGRARQLAVGLELDVPPRQPPVRG